MGSLAARVRALPWTTVIPVFAILVTAGSWGSKPATVPVILIGIVLIAAVLTAVHHAEVVAHRVGEPFGSLLLAVAVTIIEVSLIVTLMVSGGDDTATLARDTVFAAVMITCNGILGLSLLVAALRGHVAHFSAAGAATALATVATLATMTLLLPTFTTSRPGPEFSTAQLVFASACALALYALFVLVQTIRHRSAFLPVDSTGALLDDEPHAEPPSNAAALRSLGLLLLALLAVVGLAKVESSAIESAVRAAGAPQSAVGVAIALLVLCPEAIAAVRAAHRGHTQTSLNLALGSAMASIGLTIPTIAIATIWLDGPLVLGLGSMEIVLLVLTVVLGTLTVFPGRATIQQAGIHLVVFVAFVFLAAMP
jgi:Ca2+:H+ antiporter